MSDTDNNKSNKKILMKVTSRERPDVLIETLKLYYSLADNTEDMFWLFSFDENDRSYNNSQFVLAVCSAIGGVISTSHQYEFIYGVSSSKIDAINRDINQLEVEWDILLNISDDQQPVVKGYDNIIRETMPDSLDASLWFSDSHQDRINTQEILGYRYYKRFGYVYHPSYKSFFCDNESTLVAHHLRKQIKSPQCIITHKHPMWDKQGIPNDQLYKHNQQFWKHDQELFAKRKQQNFK